MQGLTNQKFPASEKEEYTYVKEKLEQHFLLKKTLKNFLSFNKKLDLYSTDFLNDTKDKQAQIHYHFYKTTYEITKLNIDLAHIHLKKAINLSKKIDLPSYKFFQYNAQSLLSWCNTNFEEAIKFSLKALKCIENIKIKNLALAHNKIAVCGDLYTYYSYLNNYQQAFIYYHKAKITAKKFNILERVAVIISKFISNNIELENYKLAKKEKNLLNEIAATSQSVIILNTYATVEIEYAFFTDSSNAEIELLLKKNKELFFSHGSPIFQIAYFLFKIKLLVRKNDLDEVFKFCELINERFKGNTTIFLHDLLHYLCWICLKDEKYINLISSSSKLKSLNINYDSEKLLQLYLSESKKYSKKLQVAAYNIAIDYYKKIGAHKKAFENVTNCFNLLKDFSLKNIHQDVSMIIEQYENSQKIEQQNNLLAQQEKMTQYFKTFAYSAAHDLKSPLITIKKFAELIKASYNNSEIKQAESYLDIIVETSKRMEAFIKELIDNRNKDSFKDEFEIIDLDEVMNNVTQNLTVLIEKSGIDIICTYEQPKIYCIKTPLEILLQNLISNAIRYRRTDVQSFVKIDCSIDGVFSISDNGVGIKKEMHRKIFEPFFRNSDKQIGSGIGLATCKRIIESLEGEIWVESKFGESSTFYFTIGHQIKNTKNQV